MEVSADGIIMCANGYAQCSNYHKHGDRKIIVEIKSPYPSEENPELVYYEVPPRHVPQNFLKLRLMMLWKRGYFAQFNEVQHLSRYPLTMTFGTTSLVWLKSFMEMKIQKCQRKFIPIT